MRRTKAELTKDTRMKHKSIKENFKVMVIENLN